MDAEPDHDLGALLSGLLAVVLDREAPILEAHGLTMWEYVILSRLEGESGLTQKELARRSRRDPTRLIGHLDALGDRGLVARDIDEADRRRRTVRLTQAGLGAVRSTRRDIREMESGLLADLPAPAQAELRASLAGVLQRFETPRTALRS